MRQRGGGPHSSVNHSFIVRDIHADEDSVDPLTFLHDSADEIHTFLREALDLHTAVRWYPSLEVVLQRHSEEGIAWMTSYFASPATILLRADEIDAQLDDAVNIIMKRIEDFVDHGSGWVICCLNGAKIHIAAFNPVGGSSFIATPERLAHRQKQLAELDKVLPALGPDIARIEDLPADSVLSPWI